MLVNSSQTSTNTNAGGFALYSQKPKNNSNKKTSTMAQTRTINNAHRSTTTHSLISRKIPFNPINKGHHLVGSYSVIDLCVKFVASMDIKPWIASTG